MTRSTDACARLAQTRAQLRTAIRAQLELAKPAPGWQPTGWIGSLWHRLQVIPGARGLVQGVNDWAARSPLAVAGLLAVDALNAAVRPIAQRHPVQLVCGAFVLGGLLTWSRPWRRVFTPALAAAVLPQLLSKVIGAVPRQGWMTLAASVLDRKSSSGRP